MPQEIVVWYVLPTIRKELAKVMVNDEKMPQKEAAKILGVSPAAISQYLKAKRGKEIVFEQEILDEIKIAARNIIKNKDVFMDEIQRICNLTNVKLLVCKIHRKEDCDLPKECNACLV